MYLNLQPVDKDKHSKFKFKTISNFLFAAQTVSVPITVAEVSKAALYYPVVFSAAGEEGGQLQYAMPRAVFSFVAECNPFINKKGTWLASYVPAHIRRYPFALSAVGDTDKYALMLDVESPNIKKRGGDLLFDEDGKLSPALERAQSFAKKYHQDVLLTRSMMIELEKSNVLVPYQFAIGNKENPRRIRGFRVVDPKRLAALDDVTLAGWVRNGVMSLVFAHMISMDNVRKIVDLQAEALKS